MGGICLCVCICSRSVCRYMCWGQVSPVALRLQFRMCMWQACANARRGLKLAPGLFLHHSALYLLRQGLLPNPGFAGSASLSLTACSRIPSLHLPRDGIKGGLRHPTSFMWVLGIWTPVLTFTQQVLYLLSHPPSPSPGLSRQSL